MTADTVTILICTWNRAGLLAETLESIARLHVPPSLAWDVLIVDNNSTDGTHQVVAERTRGFPVPVHYVFEPRQGKSYGMNTGLRHATTSIVAFVDDDVRVDPRWLSVIMTAFREHPQISYVGGPVAPIWESPCPQWLSQTGRTLWGTLAILDYGEAPFIFEERQRIPLGANFAIRRQLVTDVGDFSVTLGRNSTRVLLGQELPEFFARCRERGVVGMYLPEMRVEHHVPARRLRPNYFRRWWYGKGISRARMEAMHPVTELGLDLRTVPTIAGVPRFLLGSAVRDVVRWGKALVRCDRGSRYAAETQLCYVAGQLRERLRRIRLRDATRDRSLGFR
jgi:glycosyltransferase involved in cell wall biosynthesis